MSKRREYSPEFKRGAVEQARQPGVSCAQVTRELGIGANLLTRWKREADADGHRAFGGTGKPRDEEVARQTRERIGPGVVAKLPPCIRLYSNLLPNNQGHQRLVDVVVVTTRPVFHDKAVFGQLVEVFGGGDARHT